MKYSSPTVAMSHQRDALAARTRRPPGYADAFADQAEMGCGKTKVILDEWQEMVGREYVLDLLVVAPAGCLRNWHEDKTEEQPSELRRHLDPALLRSMVTAAWSGGTRARRAVREMCGAADLPRALFVNVEALSTNEEIVRLCVAFLKTGRGAMMVVDESTTIRAKRSRRTQVITKILGPLAKVRRIMSGLMTPKSPLDLFWQFYFLDHRILGYGDSFVTFRRRYAETKHVTIEPWKVVRAKVRQVMGLDDQRSASYYRSRLQMVYEVTDSSRVVTREASPRQVREELEAALEGMDRDQAVAFILRAGSWIKNFVEVSGYKNLEELRDKVAPFTHRVLKANCLDLPPKIWMPPRAVELTKEQRRMYDDMLARCTAELENRHVVASTVISQMIRLHQIALGHCADENGAVFDVPSNRIRALLEVLEDCESKVIIWSSYRREIDKIVAALTEEYGPRAAAQFHGGNKGSRDEDERRFLSDPECRFMVSTQAAGGRGNTWVVADTAIYCSNTHDLELRLQSEDRAHRKGQTRAVTYLDLYVPGTVEERIIYALREKIDLATVISGENYREWLV